MELEIRETEEESGISKKLIKAIIVGASVLGLGAWLLGRILHHTIPPIIIKSVDNDPEPVEVESPTTLVESKLLGDAVLPAARNVYTKRSFGKTKYVKVLLENTVTQVSEPPKEYRNKAGIVVQVWLQHNNGGMWEDDPASPQMVVTGTTLDFHLESDQLSRDKPNGNPFRRRKRSYNKNNKRWRISEIQVDNDKIPTVDYDDVRIAFDNHF